MVENIGFISGEEVAEMLSPGGAGDLSGVYQTLTSLPEAVQDIVGAMVANGANITATYDDTAGTLTIAVSGTIPAGSMPAFSGDASSVAGATVLTLATVNANVGSFGGAAKTVTATVNAKGLVTAFAEAAIAITASQVTDFSTGVGLYNAATATKLLNSRTIGISGDATWSSGAFDGSANVTAALTFATVNTNTGAWGSSTQVGQITLDGKGRATAAANVTITPAVGSITGLASGVATLLATFSSANLAAALTDETGTGANVFATSPALVSPSVTAGITVAQATAGQTAGAITGPSGARILIDSAGGNINIHDANESRFRDSTGATNILRILTTVILAGLPVGLKSYTVAGVPSASGGSGAGMMIYVSNESGGAVVAFSDGSQWRRVTDRAVIS